MKFCDLGKDMISNHFSRVSDTYDRYATVQRVCAQQLVLITGSSRYFKDINSVIDIGSGSGNVIEFLYKLNPCLCFTANDISLSMLKFCRSKFAKLGIPIKCIDADVETYHFDDAYDLVISNLCFQWLSDFYSSVTKLAKCGNKMFVFSTLLDGTFSAWQRAHAAIGLSPPLVSSYQGFDAIKEYLCTLFDYKVIAHYRHKYFQYFNDVYDFLRYLKSLGANYSARRYSVAELRKLDRWLGSGFYMEYEVFSAGLVRRHGL